MARPFRSMSSGTLDPLATCLYLCLAPLHRPHRALDTQCAHHDQATDTDWGGGGCAWARGGVSSGLGSRLQCLRARVVPPPAGCRCHPSTTDGWRSVVSPFVRASQRGVEAYRPPHRSPRARCEAGCRGTVRGLVDGRVRGRSNAVSRAFSRVARSTSPDCCSSSLRRSSSSCRRSSSTRARWSASCASRALPQRSRSLDDLSVKAQPTGRSPARDCVRWTHRPTGRSARMFPGRSRTPRSRRPPSWRRRP